MFVFVLKIIVDLFESYSVNIFFLIFYFILLFLLLFFINIFLASIIMSYAPHLCAKYVLEYLEIKVDLNFLKSFISIFHILLISLSPSFTCIKLTL